MLKNSFNRIINKQKKHSGAEKSLMFTDLILYWRKLEKLRSNREGFISTLLRKLKRGRQEGGRFCSSESSLSPRSDKNSGETEARAGRS